MNNIYYIMMGLDSDLDLDIRLELENVGLLNSRDLHLRQTLEFFSTVSALNFDMCMISTRIKTHLLFRSFCSSLAQATVYES